MNVQRPVETFSMGSLGKIADDYLDGSYLELARRLDDCKVVIGDLWAG